MNQEFLSIKALLLPLVLVLLCSFILKGGDNDYLDASNKAVDFLVSQMQPNGSYEPSDDLAAYYKSPTTLYAAGKVAEANKMVDYIRSRFMQPNGDFLTSSEIKTGDPALVEYYHYTNGWIAMGCHRLGRFDVAVPSNSYLLDFYNKHQGGFNTTGPYEPCNKENIVTDTLSASHGGLMALYFGDMDKAKLAGDLLIKFFEKQENLDTGFYLRMDRKDNLITQFPDEESVFYIVRSTEVNQAYFFIGYPIAYLGILYRATGDIRYQNAADDYLEFALNTTGNIRNFFFAHKVGWGAAINAKNTGNPSYVELARDIANHLVSIQQPNGQFLPELGVFGSFDQTAEIALWLRYIQAELKGID